MRRVLIVGSPGAGKSTLALALDSGRQLYGQPRSPRRAGRHRGGDRLPARTRPVTGAAYRWPDRTTLEASGLHRDPLDREFLAFIWHFPAVARRQLALLSGRPGLEVAVLRSDAQVRRWLAEVGRPT